MLALTGHSALQAGAGLRKPWLRRERVQRGHTEPGAGACCRGNLALREVQWSMEEEALG